MLLLLHQVAFLVLRFLRVVVVVLSFQFLLYRLIDFTSHQ